MNTNKHLPWWAFMIPLPAIIWFALKIAPFMRDGLPGLIQNFDALEKGLQSPFSIALYENSLRTVAVFLFLYGMAISLWLTTRRHTRNGEEHGSARWANLNQLIKRYSEDVKTDRILSQRLRMSLHTRKHRRTLNTMISGGTGAGKTRFVLKPNLLQANTSYVVLDPAGELMQDMGPYLLQQGYRVLTLNLKDFLSSCHYNPFVYIENEKDVYTLVKNLIKATRDRDERTNDPFWDNASEALLAALVFLLMESDLTEDQNFGAVVELIEKMEIDENASQSNHVVDQLFNAREKVCPYSQAVRQYKIFKQAAGKTAKSIVVTLAVRLRHFTLPELVFMTSDDELELQSFGDRKTALFIVTPVSDTSYNYIVSLLYLQLFQQLYRRGDSLQDFLLPVHVQVLMDEFANVALPPDFKEILATCRKYNISIHPFIQSLAQLKSIFKDDWEVLEANCDTFVYLGGNDQFTNEHISKKLGKETIDTMPTGVTKGTHGSTTRNYQRIGRELLTAQEVQKIDNEYCLVIIRGENAAFDRKYDLEKHPQYEKAEKLKDEARRPTKHRQAFLTSEEAWEENNSVLYSSDDF